ncbi:MAG: PEP-CTERM sorting domain-containing protein [Planctomyces sp.]|nr:PEP-CTERM sorting domain-containing protein [Planctomyces sp.]
MFSSILRSYRNLFAVAFSIGSVFLLQGACVGGVIFQDDFDSTPSPLWGNQAGSWSTTSGRYSASASNNWPHSRSILSLSVTDFVLEVDVFDIADGGIWLRGDADGRNGILLVTGGEGWGFGRRDGNAGTALYWHRVIDGVVNPIEGEVSFLFTPEVSDTHLRVEVIGDKYAAFVSGHAGPVTTLETSLFSTGHVGLYDFSVQSFDNFVLSAPAAVPEPASIAMWGAGAIGAFAVRRRRQPRP